jgi:AcrR family transcriptional regulator
MTNAVGSDRTERSRVAIRKQRTRAAILSAAESLFSRQGYDDTTMQEIASLAEVGLGTMYGYFPSKEDVLRTVLDGRRREVVAQVTEALQTLPNAVDRACLVLRHTWAYLHEHRQMAIALIAFDANGANQRESRSADHNETLQALITILRNGAARGEVAVLPIETTARSLLSVYTWAALQLGIWRGAPNPEGVLQDLDQLTRRLLRPTA